MTTEDEPIRIKIGEQFVIDEVGDVPARYLDEQIKAATRSIQERLEAMIVPIGSVAAASSQAALTADTLSELWRKLKAELPPTAEAEPIFAFLAPAPEFRVPLLYHFGAESIFKRRPLAFTLCEGSPAARWRRLPRKTKKAIAKRWIVHSVTLHEHVTGIRGHRITMGPRERWRVNAWRCRRRR